VETRPEAGNVRTVIRRRRTRRHRRNRLIRRILVFATLAGFAFGISSVALHYLSPSLFRASGPTQPDRQSAESSRNLFLAAQQQALRRMGNRPVYPYSVVPGGVKDAQELKWAAEHDPVVAAHYAGFDYDHARVVRLILARTAYVSYRIGNKVYWTRHRISLKKGETLITDGKITARTRCGNRVEEVPQQAHSRSEPPPEKFEQPIPPPIGTAVANPPVPFQSALNRPPLPGFGPALPLGVYDPMTPGNWIPISPPPLPDVCGPIQKKKTNGTETVEVVESAGKNGKKISGGDPCGGAGGGEVPEPGTWVLMISGLALVYWMSRNRFVRT
jgi:hypothetical protein